MEIVIAALALTTSSLNSVSSNKGLNPSLELITTSSSSVGKEKE